ncbi:MAG: hypothetical protein WB538_08160 [Candidatus Sulfotelmatobacter sp.]
MEGHFWGHECPLQNLGLAIFRGIAGGSGELLNVAIFMDGLAVFIGMKVYLKIDGRAAKCARYFLEAAAAHECLL